MEMLLDTWEEVSGLENNLRPSETDPCTIAKWPAGVPVIIDKPRVTKPSLGEEFSWFFPVTGRHVCRVSACDYASPSWY